MPSVLFRSNIEPQRRSQWRCWVLAIALTLALGCAVATQVHAQATPDPQPGPDQPLIEGARNQVRTLSESVARNVDSWFGDRPFEDGGKVSQGRLSLSVLHRRDQGTDVDVRFTARFKLPNFEKSAYLFVGREDPRELLKDNPAALNTKQQLLVSRPEDRSFLGGLGLNLGDHVSFRVGVSAHLQPFVQARYDKPWLLAPNHLLGFRETLFWSRKERFGSTTALSYEFTVQPQLALRWLTAATITQETRNIEWSSTLGAYRTFAKQRLLSGELLFTGSGTRGTGVGQSDRGVLVKWEQPLYKEWLVGEVVGGHFWPKADVSSPRGRAWAIGASLKMHL